MAKGNADRLKICFVLLNVYPVFRPDCGGKFGGAEVVIYLLSSKLAESEGYEVSCVSKDFGQQSPQEVNGVTLWKIYQGGRILRRIPGIRHLLSVLGLYRMLGRINADIYVQFCAGVETGVAGLFCRRHGKKFVFRAARDYDCDGTMERQECRIVSACYHFGLQRTDLVITLNRLQQEWLRRRFNLDSIVMATPHKIGPPPEGKRDFILWVGRAVPVKQPEVFLRLAKRFPQEKFLMIIPQAHDRKYHREIIQAASAIENLEVKSWVPFQESDAYFERARVVVNTSTHEGFPNTFIQAAKSGTPILSLQVNPDEVLTTKGIGLCAQGSFERMVEEMERLLRDEESYTQISQRAYQYARTHHDLDRLGPEYARIFESLLR